MKRMFPYLTDEEIEELNGKWIAIVKNRKTGDMEIIRKPNGIILADENPINVQIEALELHPRAENSDKESKRIIYCRIHEHFGQNPA